MVCDRSGFCCGSGVNVSLFCGPVVAGGVAMFGVSGAVDGIAWF